MAHEVRRKSPGSGPARRKIEKVMREFRKGTLRLPSGQRVVLREQAVAIALDAARKSRRRRK